MRRTPAPVRTRSGRRHVEAEAAGRVTVDLCVGQLRVEAPDLVEGLGVGRRVGARRSPDGLLGDADDLVDEVKAVDARVGTSRISS